MKLGVDARGLLSRGSLIAAPTLCCCSCSSRAFCLRSFRPYPGMRDRIRFPRRASRLWTQQHWLRLLRRVNLGSSRSVFSPRCGPAFRFRLLDGVTLCGIGSMPLKKGMSKHCCAVGRFVGSQCMHARIKTKASGLAFGRAQRRRLVLWKPEPHLVRQFHPLRPRLVVGSSVYRANLINSSCSLLPGNSGRRNSSAAMTRWRKMSVGRW